MDHGHGARQDLIEALASAHESHGLTLALTCVLSQPGREDKLAIIASVV
jgi:hypothetical protein